MTTPKPGRALAVAGAITPGPGGDVAQRTLDAERELIGCCLRSEQAIIETIEILDDRAFLDARHRRLFAALVSMTAAGEPVTPATLRAWIEADRDTLDMDWLAALGRDTATVKPAAAAALARIVWEEACRRAIAAAGQRLIELAHERGEDAAELLRRAMDFLDACSRESTPAGQMAITIEALMSMEIPFAGAVIEGLLHRQEKVVLLAGEGSGKTELGFQAAFALAAGVHPFTGDPIEPGRALIIDFENPLANLQARTRRHAAAAAKYPQWDARRIGVFARPGGIDLWLPAHRFLLAEVIRRAAPDLVIGGPLYKMMVMDGERDIARHSAIARFFDQMMERHHFATWLETHAPATTAGGKRQMRPQGWGGWGQWATFGWALQKDPGSRGKRVFTSFRDGPREEGRNWPEAIERATPGGWPWSAVYPSGTFAEPPAIEPPEPPGDRPPF